MNELELRTAAGRIIMPAIRADDPSFWPLACELARPAAARGMGAGGFLVFGGDRETLPAKLAEVREAALGTPLLFSSDLERGAGQQVRGLTRLPHLMALGAAGDADLARRAGLNTAREARACGIHLIFGPDTDLNTDPRNPIINIRALGDDGAAVGRLAQAWISGAREGRALSCAKHFPGHGHTAVDSHIALPKLDAPLAVLKRRELAPFAAVAAGPDAVDTIMTAHMAVPALTGDETTPVTMSPRAIRYLREELGFLGLIVTDALLMGGITAAFDEAEAGVQALAAGCDILLCPANPVGLADAVVKAVQEGRVSEARLLEAVARLDRAIAACGAGAPAPTKAAERDPQGMALADEIAARGLTSIRGARPAGPADVVVVVSGDPGEAWGDLVAEVHRRAPAARLLPVATDSPDERLAGVLGTVEAAVAKGERIGVALFSKILAWKGGAGAGFPEREGRFVEDLCARAPGAAVVSCGSPYLLEHAARAAFAACAFSDEPASQRAAAAALVAGADFPGRLPVRLEAALPAQAS